jgi:two-component system, NarL family, sensor kinase
MPSEETNIRLTIWLVVIFTSILVVCFLFFVMLYQRRQSNMIAKKKEMESAFQQTLLQTQIEIQEQTLTNISQELHDNVGQTLSLAKLNLNTLKWQNIDEVKEKIDASKHLITESLINIRDIAKSMLGEKITAIGLQEAVKNELKIIKISGKYEVDFIRSEEPINFTPQQEIVVFRIIQEALHNITKHAQATSIIVHLTTEKNITSITLTDNGKGFDAEKLLATNTGVGLTNMKNRAALIGAQIVISSKENKGTIFSVKIMH